MVSKYKPPMVNTTNLMIIDRVLFLLEEQSDEEEGEF